MECRPLFVVVRLSLSSSLCKQHPPESRVNGHPRGYVWRRVRVRGDASNWMVSCCVHSKDGSRGQYVQADRGGLE